MKHFINLLRLIGIIHNQIIYTMQNNIKPLPPLYKCLNLILVGFGWGQGHSWIEKFITKQTESLDELKTICEKVLQDCGDLSEKLGILLCYQQVDRVEIDGKIYNHHNEPQSYFTVEDTSLIDKILYQLNN